MRAPAIVALGLAVVAALGASTTAGAATWTAVPGTTAGGPLASAADGPRTLVLSGDRRDLIIATIGPRGGVRRETIARLLGGGRARHAQLLRLPDGAAVAMWQDGATIRSSFRARPGARFGAPRIVDPRPGARALAPAAARAGAGALVAWWGGPAEGRLGIHAASLTAGGAWGAPVEVSAGTYPQPTSPGPAPPVALAAAGAADGSAGVVWRAPEGPSFHSPTATTLVAARRSAAGVWQPPQVLATGVDLTSYALTAAAGPTTVTGAWAEARPRRPDGVVATTCLVGATATPTGVDRRDLACRAGYDSGRTVLTGTGGGGTLALWAQGPDGPPLRTSLTAFARPPGATAWSPGTLVVSDRRGDSALDGAVARPGGGVVLAVRLGIGSGPRTGGRARVILTAENGTPGRRIVGPRSPVVRSNRHFRLDMVGPRRAVLTVTGDGYPSRYRTSILRLSAADLA